MNSFQNFAIFLGLISTCFYGANCKHFKESKIYLKPDYDVAVKAVKDNFFMACCTKLEVGKLNWYDQNGKHVKQGNSLMLTEIGDKSERKLILGFNKVERHHEGNWTCILSENGYKTSEMTFTLITFDATQFDEKEISITANDNDEVVLPCDVKGDPEPTITWLLDGGALDQQALKDLDLQIVADGLIVKKAAFYNEGTYTCRAHQQNKYVANTVEKIFNFEVNSKPVIKETNATIYALKHSTVKLICEVGSHPSPEFQWYRHSSHIIMNTNTTDYASEISVTLNHDHDFGNYTCKAQNHIGFSQFKFTIVEGRVPESPENLILIAEGNDLLELGFKDKSIESEEEDEFLPLSHYRFQYISKDDYINENSWENAKIHEAKVIGEGRDKNFVISDLNSNSLYLVRVAVNNSLGFSEWSDVVEFSTLDLEKPRNINHHKSSKNIEESTSTESNELKDSKPYILSENQTIYALKHATIELVCEVKSHSTPEFLWYKHGKHVTDHVHTTDLVSRLTVKLHHNHDFENYTCRAQNQFGISRVYYTIVEGNVPKTPKTLQSDKQYAHVIELKFGNDDKEDDDEDDKIPLSHYRFQYIKEDEFDENPWNNAKIHETPILQSDNEIYKISDLEPSSLYLVRVAVNNSLGFSDWSEVFKFKTNNEIIPTDQNMDKNKKNEKSSEEKDNEKVEKPNEKKDSKKNHSKIVEVKNFSNFASTQSSVVYSIISGIIILALHNQQ